MSWTSADTSSVTPTNERKETSSNPGDSLTHRYTGEQWHSTTVHCQQRWVGISEGKGRSARSLLCRTQSERGHPGHRTMSSPAGRLEAVLGPCMSNLQSGIKHSIRPAVRVGHTADYYNGSIIWICHGVKLTECFFSSSSSFFFFFFFFGCLF